VDSWLTSYVPLIAKCAMNGAPGTRPLVLVGEDGFDGGGEEAGKLERQRKRGVVLAGLDGVDGLARDFEALREVGLRPVALGTQNAEAVIHCPPCAGER
jgi:hypothetical protein